MIKLIRNYGKTSDNKEIMKAILTNSNNMEVHILNIGCAIEKILIEDKEHNIIDVCLGYKSPSEYEHNPSSFGAVVGRHANRIKDAKFILNNTLYKLSVNEFGHNHIHGGKQGFAEKVWDMTSDDNKLILSYNSLDLEEGYPGNLRVIVTYQLTNNNELSIDYFATSDKDTIINLTNHCYFNLNGEGNKDILNHELFVDSNAILELDDELCPTGNILSVENTPFDFRKYKPLGKDIDSKNSQIMIGKGYDHNFILNNKSLFSKVVSLYNPLNDLTLDVFTDQIGIQIYSGNFLDGVKGKHLYTKRTGICLETQHYPNSMCNDHFPSIILKKDEEYKTRTVYKLYFKNNR